MITNQTFHGVLGDASNGIALFFCCFTQHCAEMKGHAPGEMNRQLMRPGILAHISVEKFGKAGYYQIAQFVLVQVAVYESGKLRQETVGKRLFVNLFHDLLPV